jgi:short-subunit dehydrogenase
MDFKNQVILITGASSGIGRRLALDLTAKGAVVVGCGRSQERLQQLLKEMRLTSPASTVFVCDMMEPAEVASMIGDTLAEFGRIDILINNAGIGMRQPFAEMPLATIAEIMRTNYFGTVYCTHEALPSMIARGSGHIVNISSGAGKIGSLNMGAYSASKFAINGLSESLYHELKPLGIHVSVVSPGPVRTEFNRLFVDTEPKSPAALMITPEAVSRAVLRVIETKEFDLVMPRWLAFACWLKRLMPNIFRIVSHRRFRAYVRSQKNHHA